MDADRRNIGTSLGHFGHLMFNNHPCKSCVVRHGLNGQVAELRLNFHPLVNAIIQGQTFCAILCLSWTNSTKNIWLPTSRCNMPLEVDVTILFIWVNWLFNFSLLFHNLSWSTLPVSFSPDKSPRLHLSSPLPASFSSASLPPFQTNSTPHVCWD